MIFTSLGKPLSTSFNTDLVNLGNISSETRFSLHTPKRTLLFHRLIRIWSLSKQFERRSKLGNGLPEQKVGCLKRDRQKQKVFQWEFCVEHKESDDTTTLDRVFFVQPQLKYQNLRHCMSLPTMNLCMRVFPKNLQKSLPRFFLIPVHLPLILLDFGTQFQLSLLFSFVLVTCNHFYFSSPQSDVSFYSFKSQVLMRITLQDNRTEGSLNPLHYQRFSTPTMETSANLDQTCLVDVRKNTTFLRHLASTLSFILKKRLRETESELVHVRQVFRTTEKERLKLCLRETGLLTSKPYIGKKKKKPTKESKRCCSGL